MNLLPERGFVRDYLVRYIGRDGQGAITDAPPLFHVATAYTLLAAAFMDRVRIRWAGGLRPTNLYTILLANSTKCRKTTVVETGAALFAANEELAYYLGPNESSAEGLLMGLDERNTLLLIFREMGDFLITANTWGERLKPLLMDLADAPPLYWKRLARQEFRINNPLVSVLAALNLALMSEIRGTQLDWHSGFFARFLLIAPGGLDGAVSLDWRPGQTITFPPTADEATRTDLGNYLKSLRERVAKRGGPGAVFVFDGPDPEATEVFSSWCAELDALALDSDTPASFDRLKLSCMKIAALLTLDFTRGESKMITGEAMIYATRFCTAAANSLRTVLGGYAPTMTARELQRVERAIQRAGTEGVRKRDVLRTAHVLLKDFGQIVSTLEVSGRIVVERDESGSEWYVAAEFRDTK